jgi:outer membrane protein TolC
MVRVRWRKWAALVSVPAAGLIGCTALERWQDPPLECAPSAHEVMVAADTPPAPLAAPAPAADDKPLPITLPAALQLAGVRPLDIALAASRIAAADAELERAEVLWLPTVYVGTDYFRHDGQIQDVAGNVFGTSKSSFMVGAGPSAVFAVADAIFAPLAARQQVREREAALQASRNDSLLAVAEAYFNVQQARGELAGAQDAARRAEALLRATRDLAKDLVAPVDEVRAQTELERREEAVDAARERWRTASADLARLLRLDPSAVVEPLEPPHLRVTLLPPDRSLDELLLVALSNRPELAAQQAVVAAAQERLRQERWRPLIPSVMLRGASTPVTGALAGGGFGGGLNDSISNFSARSDFDVQVLWEWRSLGLDNLARIKGRDAERAGASLDLLRVEDRVTAEVKQAHAQVQSAAARLQRAERAVKYALDSFNKHVSGMKEPLKVGNVLVPLIRPQEAVNALQTLAQTYGEYYGAVGDYDRAQFRLYRALGQPAQALTDHQNDDAPCPKEWGPAPLK